MRIIKLEIEVISRNYSIRVLRQAVSLDKSSIKKISEFIDYVKKLCHLKGQYEIDIDGFRLAPNDTVKILKENRIYTLALVREQIDNISSNGQQSSSEEAEFQQNLQQNLTANKPGSQQKVTKNNVKVPKIQQKTTKKLDKEMKMKNKKVKSESELEQQSESEQSQSSIKPTITKRRQLQKQASRKPESQRLQSSKTKNHKIQNVRKELGQKLALKTNTQKKDLHQQDSSSSSASSELPVFKKEDKRSAPSTTQKNIQPIIQNKLSCPMNNQNKIKVGAVLKRSIIRDSSSQSSPSKEKTPKVQPKKIEYTQPTIANQSKPQNLKLPPALRNKMQTNKFQKHQQNQWIVVDKEKYHRWQQLGYKTLSQPPNKIRFKIVELDEEKFIPVKSNWITGEVGSTTQSGIVHLTNVEQEGKDFMKNYQIPQMNMDELQIFRPLATKEQLECLCGSAQQDKEKQVERNQPIKSEVTMLQQPPNSVQKFVCGQVNYYFSDKNYLTDCYMQLHANSHPQKYMKLSFMLNFPKIKKVLRDEDKLLEYLRDDDKYETRNYEIDFDNKMIRKKNIIQQASNQISNNIKEDKMQQIGEVEKQQSSIKAEEK